MKTNRSRNGYRASVGRRTYRFWREGKWWRTRAYRAGRRDGFEGTHETLRAAKAAAGKHWIRQVMYDLWFVVRPRVQGGADELLALYAATRDDDLAPRALRDWMEERGLGDELEAHVLGPGREVKVVWPAGWAEAAAE